MHICIYICVYAYHMYMYKGIYVKAYMHTYFKQSREYVHTYVHLHRTEIGRAHMRSHVVFMRLASLASPGAPPRRSRNLLRPRRGAVEAVALLRGHGASGRCLKVQFEPQGSVH